MTTGPAFTIEASQFRALLSTVAPAVMSKATSLPILSGVHLAAADNTGQRDHDGVPVLPNPRIARGHLYVYPGGAS